MNLLISVLYTILVNRFEKAIHHSYVAVICSLVHIKLVAFVKRDIFTRLVESCLGLRLPLSVRLVEKLSKPANKAMPKRSGHMKAVGHAHKYSQPLGRPSILRTLVL